MWRGLIALAVIPTMVAAGPYDGLYRPDADWAESWDCETIGADGGAIAIRDDIFFGVETQCQLTNPVQVRDMDATLYDQLCSGEGETWQSRLMILDTPEGIVTVRDGGDVARFIRCE